MTPAERDAVLEEAAREIDKYRAAADDRGQVIVIRELAKAVRSLKSGQKP